MPFRLVFVVMLLLLPALAQPKPRIDFDALLKSFPDLPWNFEIRYVAKDNGNTDMLRIHYNGQAEVVRWRPEYAGSLASVCQTKISEGEFKKLVILLRNANFNDLPSESEVVVAVAMTGQQTVSVRVGKTIVRKIDRGSLNSHELRQVEDRLAAVMDSINPESNARCEMESVPAQP
jgi:hypothetical protein